MRQVGTDIAVGVAGGAAVLLLTLVVEDMPLWLQITVVASAFGVFFVLAHLVRSKGTQTANHSGVRIGTGIRSKRGVQIEQISAEAKGDTSIGSEITANDDVTLKDIHVTGQEPPDDTTPRP